MKLTFHGHAAFEIETGGHRLWIDPFLTGNPSADVTADTVGADYIIVSHAHGDHLGDTEAIAKRTGATVVAIVELANHLASQGVKTEALQIGGGQQFPFGRVKLVPAFHSSALDGVAMGREAGILLRDNEGAVLYHAGDTALFSDMALIGGAGIDVALVPIGDKFTMGPEDAATAVSFLHPRIAVPIHYNTIEHITQDAEAWKTLVETRTTTSVVVMAPGDSLQVTKAPGR